MSAPSRGDGDCASDGPGARRTGPVGLRGVPQGLGTGRFFVGAEADTNESELEQVRRLVARKVIQDGAPA